MPVSHACLPETEDDTGSDTYGTEEDSKSKETAVAEDTVSDDDAGSDTSGTEEDSKNKETAVVEDAVGDDERPQHTTYQFHNCANVFMNAFNAHGVKVENSGNNKPQFTCMSSLLLSCDFRADEVFRQYFSIFCEFISIFGKYLSSTQASNLSIYDTQ